MAEGTQYSIEIAAKMLGVESASAQLLELEKKLTAAGDASSAAAEELALGERKYAQLEKAAIQAAKALEQAGLEGKKSFPADLKQKADAAAAALQGEAKALDALRSKAKDAATEHQKLLDAFKKTEQAAKGEVKALEAADAAARGTGNLGKLKGALGDLGGPLGTTGQRVVNLADAFADLSEVLGVGVGGVVAGVVALAAAAAIVTVAIGAAVVKTTLWAVGLADARRSAALTVEALEKTSTSLVGLGKILPGVQRSTGLGADKLQELARSLADAKVSAKDMPEALRAAATAEAALTGEGAKLVAEMKAGKKSVAELASEAESKFGGVVSKKLLSLDSQAATLKRNLGETFGGLKIDGLLEGLSKMVGLFDQSTAMGRTLKFLFEKFFQPLVDAATKAFPIIEAFLLGVAIGALKVYIAFKPAAKAIGELFDIDTSGLPDALTSAKNAGELLGDAIGKVAAGVALIVGSVALAVRGFLMLGELGRSAFGRIYNESAKVIAAIRSFSLTELGLQMMQGLANGISTGASAVMNAMVGAISGAIDAARSMLDAHSPSRVFEGLGVSVGEGFEGGIKDSSGGAQSALESMVAPPDAKGGAGASPASSGGSFNFAGASFTFNGVANAEEAEGRFGALLTRLLEGDITQLEPEQLTPEPAT